ncbi:hypothetical protein [Longimicrobium sp.]
MQAPEDERDFFGVVRAGANTPDGVDGLLEARAAGRAGSDDHTGGEMA